MSPSLARLSFNSRVSRHHLTQQTTILPLSAQTTHRKGPEPHKLRALSLFRVLLMCTGYLLLLAAPKGKAQGTGYRAQGKNNKRKLIFSLCLAPYALRLTAWAGKAIETLTGAESRFSIFNKTYVPRPPVPHLLPSLESVYLYLPREWPNS